MTLSDADPKGLIRESYAIEGITAPECRSIFLDWALSLPEGADLKTAARALIDRYAPPGGAHPMTEVLQEAERAEVRPARRGGHGGRTGSTARGG